MTPEVAALLLGILAILYAFNTTYLVRKMKKEDIEVEKRHQELLERMDKRHEETMKRIAELIIAKTEEVKELIKT